MNEPVCGESGPKPAPGMISYMCSLPVGHLGAHQAILGAELLDSWPRRVRADD